jgi:hypothetical protein
VTLSIDDVSFPSLFESPLAKDLTSVNRITPITFSLDGNASGNSRDTSRQKAQTHEDDSKAKSDPVGSNADLQPQADPTLSTNLGNDLASLLKDMTSGNTSAAKADVSKVQADLHAQDAPSDASGQAGSPLDTLIGKISDSLNSDGVYDAPQDKAKHDLANFLVENGQGTGSLINTSA